MILVRLGYILWRWRPP